MDVKTLCLGALTLGDASGYEIRKLFEDGPFGQFYDAGYGSIYPALGRLLAEGLVNVEKMVQAGRPDKKVYSLTEKGLDVFKAALAEPPVPDKVRSENVTRLFFAEFMEENTLRAVYEGYLKEFKEMSSKLKSLDEIGVAEGRRFTRGLGLAFYEGVAEYMEQNRDSFFQAVHHENLNGARSSESDLRAGAGDDD